MFFGKKKSDSSNSQNDDKIRVDTSTITTMVGADTVVKGLLKTKSSVRINGTVIGDVRADGVVVLTKTGVIEGTIEAESIIVAGKIKGNMSIKDKVNVEASGQIYGEVITKKFVIDEESIFQGNCVMNRDGKVIPVPPYISEEQKELEAKRKADEEKRIAEEVKRITEAAKKEDKKEEKKEEKKEGKEADKKDETKEEKAAEDKPLDEDKDNTDDDENKESEKSDNDDETEPEKTSDESLNKESNIDKENSDDTIIIADINEVKAADDIPTSDGNPGGRSRNRKSKKNYVKKSKSLSVEIES